LEQSALDNKRPKAAVGEDDDSDGDFDDEELSDESMGIDSDDDDGEYVDMPLPSHVAGQQAGLVAWRTEVHTDITCLVEGALETTSKPGLVCVKSRRSLTEPADLSCTPAKGSQTNGAEGAGTNQGRPLFKTNAAAPALVVAVAAAAGPSKPYFMQELLQKHG
jgi:hypothetical protein